MNSLLTQVLSGLCWVVYGSFFEWYWHKCFMHQPRFPKQAFKGHTIVHHGLYKGEQDYFCYEDRHPEHILLKPYALPALLFSHVPAMLLIEHFIPHTFWGAFLSTLAYFVVYEYAHWNMHVPRGHFIERFRWFQFLRMHHKLHHIHYQKNFCVLLPLADLVFGTLVTEQSLARVKADREAAIASGKTPQERKGRRRHARSMPHLRLPRQSSLTREFFKFKTRRVRARRKYRQVDDLRELLHLGKNRRNR